MATCPARPPGQTGLGDFCAGLNLDLKLSEDCRVLPGPQTELLELEVL